METLYHAAFVLFAALLLDLLFGDPETLPHPVRAVGALIFRLEWVLYDRESRERGVLLTVATILIVAAVVQGLLVLLSSLPALRTMLEIYLIYAALAWRSLKDESSAVMDRLNENDLDGARYAVSRIVGRDTVDLDRESIVCATVETVGENAIDGVFSPLFFTILGFMAGYPAAVVWAFKAASTLDSMVGYKNERYENFGWASARFDDVLNFIPARLGALFMLAGAALNGYIVNRAAIGGVLRDRLRHASPNSAHGESVMAWLLGIELGGASRYGGVWVEKPTLGIAARDPEPQDIARSHEIMDRGVACFLLVSLLPLLFAAQGGA